MLHGQHICLTSLCLHVSHWSSQEREMCCLLVLSLVIFTPCIDPHTLSRSSTRGSERKRNPVSNRTSTAALASQRFPDIRRDRSRLLLTDATSSALPAPLTGLDTTTLCLLALVSPLRSVPLGWRRFRFLLHASTPPAVLYRSAVAVCPVFASELPTAILEFALGIPATLIQKDL